MNLRYSQVDLAKIGSNPGGHKIHLAKNCESNKMSLQNILRTATEQELDFYHNKLYPLQDFVFSLMAGQKDVYLTGGTALARFYFKHRLSEDLDFFVKVKQEHSLETIERLRRTDIYARDLAGKLRRKFDIVNEWYGDTYSRFYIQTDYGSLKIDFVREYNHIGEMIPQPEGFYINNLDDIGAGKIAAFEDRCEIKDIVDLYYLTRQIPLSRLFELADIKRVPAAYENLLTINTQGVSGVALMVKEIPIAELTNLIDSLKYEAEMEIKKKEELAAREIDEIIEMNLWDFPAELKNINPHSIPVLKRRLNRMPLPQRNVLKKLLPA